MDKEKGFDKRLLIVIPIALILLTAIVVLSFILIEQNHIIDVAKEKCSSQQMIYYGYMEQDDRVFVKCCTTENVESVCGWYRIEGLK